MWICVRSKDAQKQLARTSLNTGTVKREALGNSPTGNPLRRGGEEKAVIIKDYPCWENRNKTLRVQKNLVCEDYVFKDKYSISTRYKSRKTRDIIVLIIRTCKVLFQAWTNFSNEKHKLRAWDIWARWCTKYLQLSLQSNRCFSYRYRYAIGSKTCASYLTNQKQNRL